MNQTKWVGRLVWDTKPKKRKVPDNAGCHQAGFLFAWWHGDFRTVAKQLWQLNLPRWVRGWFTDNSPRTYRGETERRARIWKMTWVYPHSRRGAEGTGAVVKAADGIPSAKRKVPDNAGCHQAEFLFAWWHRNFREVFGGVVDTQKPHAGFAAAGARKARSLAGWYYGCSWGGRESRSWINSAVELLNKYAIRMICPYHSLRSGRYKMQSSPAPSVDMRSRDQIAFHKREFTSSALEIRRKPELDYYAPTDIQGAEALPHRIVSDIAGPGASARL
ncbi:hypothetical protein FN846DRAFT_889930 [Sphaerosporella brunnea]|uniref:Uncharacterized protein n=1 Tax=Sphaerosporella brunnea TaxID=1250544 RepID=A0A5J5EZ66_9PEZI|nr:hypothetical protein FN846DRAFT_889930 [Sphaerosporella brunnea]